MNRALMALGLTAALSGCDDMSHQAKRTAYADPTVAPAPQPAGRVGYGAQPSPPPPVSLALLQRGQARYAIYCVACHSALGDGRGMIVQRGFAAPPDYASLSAKDSMPEHIETVIAQGYGAMYGFADRVPAADRWAIAAYVHALQVSRTASLASLTPAEQGLLRP